MAIFTITMEQVFELIWISSCVLLGTVFTFWFINYESAPPRPKLIRSVPDVGDTLIADISSGKVDPSVAGYYRIIQPLVWQVTPSAEGDPDVAPIPENLKPNCYPAQPTSATELANSIEQACESLAMEFKKHATVYRWDVRNHNKHHRSDIILEIQIFYNENNNGNLLVYFKIHHTYDNYLAHTIIDQIAKFANLDMSVTINPWTKAADFVTDYPFFGSYED